MRSTCISLLVALWSSFWAPQFANSQDPLSLFLKFRSERKFAEAEDVLLNAWKQTERNSPRSTISARICHNLGKFYYERGRYLDAERFFKRALAIWDSLQPAQLERQADTVNSLAIAYLDENRYESVERLYAKYHSGWLASLKPDNIEIARSWNILGYLHYRRGDFMKAEELYLKGIELSDQVAALNNLGVLYFESGRLDKARDYFTRVLAIEANGPDADVIIVVKTNLNLAAVHCRAKRCDEALILYDKSLQTALEVLGPEHPLPAIAAARYAEALRTLKLKDQAKRMERLARQLREVSEDETSVRLTVDVGELERRTR
jgi:tetratricopeptide (TPR) repeat protein